MLPKESRDLKKQYKRMIWFVAIVFIFAAVICYLLILAGLSPVASGAIIIVIVGILYLLFLFICAKIDKKKAAKQKKQESRDPFSH